MRKSHKYTHIILYMTKVQLFCENYILLFLMFKCELNEFWRIRKEETET